MVPKFLSMLLVLLVCLGSACTSKKVPVETKAKIQQFLKDLVSETLEQDYRSHGMNMQVAVTNLAIETITQKQTGQDNVYDIKGSVSYIVKGNRTWKDKEGNIIRLGPEQEVTHWFSCGVLEDRYMRTLFKDERNRLTFYAEKSQ